MARQHKRTPAAPDSVSVSELTQLGLWDNVAAQIGLEPAYSKQDLGSNKATGKTKKKKFAMEKWEKPFLRPDGLIWCYVGYGEWEAHPPDYYRVKYQFEWLQKESHFRGERQRLETWLGIRAAQEERERTQWLTI